jgi:eukaryotic-like serine/threonine-protein kinase
MKITPGARINQYEIVSPLGAGGMGEVFLANDERLGRKVAIKFLAADVQSGDRRLIAEAKAAATLDHPNICAIYEIGDAGDGSFIVLQYVEGETLAARLERGPIEVREALAIAMQIADGLAEAHSHGIIHRDVKPQNVMLAARGQVKMLDFGLAKVMRDPSGVLADAATSVRTTSGMVVGTVPYMSPEQLRGEPLDARTDIFSFGVVLYELLSGRRPFRGQTTPELMAAILTADPAAAPIPAPLQRLVRKTLQKKPPDRHQSMAELRLELEQIRSAYESGTERRWSKARVATAALLAVAAIAIAAGLYRWARAPGVVTLASTVQPAGVNSRAYDLYLRGKVNVAIENRVNNEAAIQLFRQAIALKPDFAPAYAELARAYNIKSRYFAADAEKAKLNEDAEVAVDKSLALDPNVAEGHFARGLLLWTHAKRFPHEQTIQSYRRAIELNPRFDEAHHQLGFVYLHIGLLDDGWKELEAALAINPGNTLARYRFGVIHMCRGEYEDALAIFKSTPLENNPSLWTSQMTTALFRLGRSDEAGEMIAAFLDKYPNDEGGAVTSVRAMILARAGDARGAEDAIARSIAAGRDYGHFHHTAYNIASAYALLNRPAEALQWLETTADDGFPCYPLFAKDAQLDNLRKDPRFLTLMARLRRQWERYGGA